MTQQGIVTKIENDIVYIRTRPLGCCSSEGCHCLQTNKDILFKAYSNRLDIRIGDCVEAITKPLQSFLGFFSVFAPPVLSFALGWFFLQDRVDLTMQVLAALGSGGIGFVFSFLIFKAKIKDLPLVHKVLSGACAMQEKQGSCCRQ